MLLNECVPMGIEPMTSDFADEHANHHFTRTQSTIITKSLSMLRSNKAEISNFSSNKTKRQRLQLDPYRHLGFKTSIF